MKKSKSVKSSVPAVAKAPAKVTVAKPTAPVAPITPAAPVKPAVVAKHTAAVKPAATVTTPVVKSKRGKKTVFNKFVIKGVEYNVSGKNPENKVK